MDGMTYKPGDQPDPDFVAFFNGDWQRLLETVQIPGMNEPSWDRRAAYLLWIMGGHYDAETPWHWLDVMKHATRPRPAPVGRMAFALTMLDNHFGEDDCKPTPGGVRLDFDSSKW
jgi:hypothetical protein